MYATYMQSFLKDFKKEHKRSFHFLIWVVVNQVCLFMKSQLKFLLYVTETFLNRKTRGFKPGNVNGRVLQGGWYLAWRGGSQSHIEGEGSRTEGGQ